MTRMFLLLTALTLLGTGVEAQNFRRPNRTVYARSDLKVYALLAPYRINKTMDRMQAEANFGRQKFRGLLDSQKYPHKASLLNFVTPVRDQQHRGTCVAFATVALMETMLNMPRRQGTPNLSEQYVYWASKALFGSNPNADGSEPIDMLHTLEKYGVTAEQAWPYESNPWFADTPENHRSHEACVMAYQQNPDSIPRECVTNGEPPAQAKAAPKVMAVKAEEAPTSPEYIVGAINNRIPVEIGVSVFKNAWGFGDKATRNFKEGRVTMPTPDDEEIGGHAVLIVGYDLDAKVYIFKNSWGVDDWGTIPLTETDSTGQVIPVKPRGFGIIPMDYVRKFGVAAVAYPALAQQ